MIFERGHFLPGGTRLKDGEAGINETYRGTIEVGAQRIPAYVKLLPDRQLINEIAAAALALRSGARIPRPFLVFAHPNDYPESPMLQAAPDGRIAFASEVAAGGAARRVNLSSQEAIEKFYREWKDWPFAASFDEWVANRDRHSGNFLVAGPGDVWLIDHSHCFTGADWTTADLDPNAKVPNIVCDSARAYLTIADKMNAYAAALAAAEQFSGVNAADAVEDPCVQRALDRHERAALQTFIASRPTCVAQRISERLGLPGLPLGASV